jgi:type IV secretory pathway TraG/TraD family ATPase VirD4
MLIVFAQRGALPKAYLLSPLFAIPALIAGAILANRLQVMFLPSNAGIWLNLSISITAIAFCGYAAGWLLMRRPPPSRDAHARGTVVRSGAARTSSGSGLITLAGVEIPRLDETKHFKLIGTTGSGKSTAIRELLTGAMARGDRAIIADPDGAYLSRFYSPHRGDLILNPFDPRSARWDLFAEIEQPYDVEQLARSMIPEGPDPSGHEWRGFARTLLSSVLEYCKVEGKTDLAELWRLLAVADVEELRNLLSGTAAQPFLAEGAAKMLHSIRGTATPVLNSLKYAKGSRGNPLSIRRWVREGKGVLFLPYKAGQIAAVRQLIATWLRLAIFETMDGIEEDQHLWFAMDELDALGQIDGLKDALARLRKFGGRCIVGFQSIAQVRGSYGEAESNTIVENCGTSVVLRCSASERGGTAEFASRLIGKRQIIRTLVSRSRPDNWGWSAKETRTTSHQHVTEDAVMASEIEQLPDLEGFLKLASSPEWLRVRIQRPQP